MESFEPKKKYAKRQSIFNKVIMPYVREFVFAVTTEQRHMIARRMLLELKKTKSVSDTSEGSENNTIIEVGNNNNSNVKKQTNGGVKSVPNEKQIYKYLTSEAIEYTKELIGDMKKLAIEDPDEFIDQYEIPNIINPEDIPCVASVDIFGSVTFGANRNPEKNPAFEFQVDNCYEISPVEIKMK